MPRDCAADRPDPASPSHVACRTTHAFKAAAGLTSGIARIPPALDFLLRASRAMIEVQERQRRGPAVRPASAGAGKGSVADVPYLRRPGSGELRADHALGATGRARHIDPP